MNDHQTTVTGTDASCSCGWVGGAFSYRGAQNAAMGHRFYHAEYQASTGVEPEDEEWMNAPLGPPTAAPPRANRCVVCDKNLIGQPLMCIDHGVLGVPAPPRDERCTHVFAGGEICGRGPAHYFHHEGKPESYVHAYEPPREETGGWKRTGDGGFVGRWQGPHGAVWPVPLGVEQALRDMDTPKWNEVVRINRARAETAEQEVAALREAGQFALDAAWIKRGRRGYKCIHCEAWVKKNGPFDTGPHYTNCPLWTLISALNPRPAPDTEPR